MRKGISLVALVITIIVLIILTAAVFLTGADVPANAELSVFFQDVGNVQDAVVLQIAENLSTKYDPATDDATRSSMTKYDVILEDPNATIFADPVAGSAGNISVDGEDVAVWSIEAEPVELGLSIPATELARYAIDEKGTVYYYNEGNGRIIDGVTYFKKDVTKTAQAGE